MPPPAQCNLSISPRVSTGEVEEAFSSAEEAWLWTMGALIARAEGSRSVSKFGRRTRPCEPDDVVRCLDTLYRERRINLAHVRILRVWGMRQSVPDPAYPLERADSRLWSEAVRALEWPLRVKGIVVDRPPSVCRGAAMRVGR